ncbi:MAG: hypothetical protein ACAI43_26200 [Phycisphaerae bacterium]|nr:hypothetical protein [Tepidisphaeraceae bacterium]
MTTPLSNLAHARSGDKGSGANVGVIARMPAAYTILCRRLTASRVAEFFAALGPGEVVRYELPNLHALNFVLPTVLGEGGGALSLRSDAQGKALGQALLRMELELTAEESAAIEAY